MKKTDLLEAELRDVQRTQALAATRMDEVDRLNEVIFILQNRVEEIALENRKLLKMMRSLNAKIETAGATVVGGSSNTRRRGGVHQSSAQKRTSVVPSSQPEPTMAQPAEAPVMLTNQGADDAGPAIDDPLEHYQDAYNMLQNGQMTQAAAAFEELIQAHPKHELTDNALYWRAEISYSKKNYLEALKIFQRVVDEHKAGNKVPDAMLKIGYTWYELDDKLKAKQVLKNIVEKFPWSPAAEKAKAKLAEIEAS